MAITIFLCSKCKRELHINSVDSANSNGSIRIFLDSCNCINTPSKSTFDKALSLVLSFEGGYVNDPDDPGGATKFGITQRTYDEYLKKMYNNPKVKSDIKNITPEEVSLIYHREYWVAGSCETIDNIAQLPKLAICHFDSCVNCGIYQSVKFLQRIIGTEADGIFGPLTLTAIKNTCGNDNTIIDSYLQLRRDYYDHLISQSPSLKKFSKGWKIRLVKLSKYLKETFIDKTKSSSGGQSVYH